MQKSFTALIFILLKDLNARAQGEVTIREAIRELELWGASAIFSLAEYHDNNNKTVQLIKDWKEVVNQVLLVFVLVYLVHYLFH